MKSPTLEALESYQFWIPYLGTQSYKAIEITLSPVMLEKWTKDKDKKICCIFCQTIDKPKAFLVEYKGHEYINCPKCHECQGVLPFTPETAGFE